MNRYIEALRRVAEDLHVPGAPLNLRLDTAEAVGEGVRLSWSFADPETLPHERSHNRRIHGELEVEEAQGDPEEAARAWWAEAQLAAARAFKRHVDADWIPGEPYVRRVWTADEAWQALLDHLGGDNGEVHVEGSEIRVVNGRGETVYRIDPDEWAAHLTDPEITETVDDSGVVPAAFPLVDGLPLWATDELSEAVGAWGPVVGLVDGRLVGIQDEVHPGRGE